ncbi:MAG: carbon storage regulator CsrA [Dehalococcoidales bacterium]|nr:carbon storage regulator CsrA [Dehalococcoidales bacterium]
MLLITRRVGEFFYIGDDVQVRIMGIKGNQVRVGITAPDDVAIHRSEIYDKIQQEKLNEDNFNK